MRESRTEVVVGAVVIVAAVGFLGYMLQATGLSAGSAGYDVSASFRSAEGVTVGTDVRMSGVSIGTVTGLDLNRDTFRADTQMRIRQDVPIPDDSTAVVASEGLLGGIYVEIVPGGSLDNLPDGGEILDTQGSVSLLQLLVQFAAGSTQGSAQGSAPAP